MDPPKKNAPDAESDDELDERIQEVDNVGEEIEDTEIDSILESSAKEEVINTKEEDLPPVNWTWKGYLAWYLHGSMAPKSKRLPIFIPGEFIIVIHLFFFFPIYELIFF